MDELRAKRTDKVHRKIADILIERYDVSEDKVAIQPFKRHDKPFEEFINMGEITDMHLDGTLCESCGAMFDDILEGQEPPRHTRICWHCAKDKLCCPRCRNEEIKPDHAFCTICGLKFNNSGFLRAIKKAHLSE